jgi:transcriptional regulator with XRE-family HTH domain
MNYEKIGILIASLRKEKGLTQKELADKLGITDRAVSKWERGLGCPDISLLDDLSRILDISILEILKGRRLDKDEIVNNESVIESMNYSKESLKYKFKKYFNIVSIAIIIIISSILIVSNLRSIYYLNKTYHNDYYDNQDDNILKEISDNIEKIKNNQGIYNNDEYKKILDFINELDNNLKIQNNKYYYNKNDYKYSEIVKFYYSHQKYIYLDNSSKSAKTVYEIVHNHDPRVADNIVTYHMDSSALINQNYSLFNEIKAPYYNNGKINNEVVTFISSFIDLENDRDNMLLKDIIKVGEINE